MICPKCNTNLKKDEEQTCCLVRHSDNVFEDDKGKHDHTIPCNYSGGTSYHCDENNHEIMVPSINNCQCGWVSTVKGSYGIDIGKYTLHPSETILWNETVDYAMRRENEVS